MQQAEKQQKLMKERLELEEKVCSPTLLYSQHTWAQHATNHHAHHHTWCDGAPHHGGVSSRTPSILEILGQSYEQNSELCYHSPFSYTHVLPYTLLQARTHTPTVLRGRCPACVVSPKTEFRTYGEIAVLRLLFCTVSVLESVSTP